jgi:hypothetical protein
MSISPQELEWHEAVRDTLDSRISNPNFFLWIDVEAEPGASLDKDTLREDIEEWLGELDPDAAIAEQTQPRHRLRVGGMDIQLTALPKKPEARGTSQRIVGNPVPAFAYFVGN